MAINKTANVEMFSLCDGEGCWNPEPHDRPSFRDILSTLDVIRSSSFVNTSSEHFQSMQDNWNHEIESMFEELRVREKVI